MNCYTILYELFALSRAINVYGYKLYNNLGIYRINSNCKATIYLPNKINVCMQQLKICRWSEYFVQTPLVHNFFSVFAIVLTLEQI